MSEATSSAPPAQPPLSVAGRSPFDQIRLKWQGVGNTVLALYCMFGAGGAGGVFFGIVFLALGIATWVIAYQADWQWYAIPPDFRRGVVAVGAAIGVAFTYLCFGVFFLVIWIFTHLADWM